MSAVCFVCILFWDFMRLEKTLFENCGKPQEAEQSCSFIMLNGFLCISVLHLMIFRKYSYFLGNSLNVLYGV